MGDESCYCVLISVDRSEIRRGIYKLDNPAVLGRLLSLATMVVGINH